MNDSKRKTTDTLLRKLSRTKRRSTLVKIKSVTLGILTYSLTIIPETKNKQIHIKGRGVKPAKSGVIVLNKISGNFSVSTI